MSEKTRWIFLDAAIKISLVMLLILAIVCAGTYFRLVNPYLSGVLAGGYAAYVLQKNSSASRRRELLFDIALLGLLVVSALLDKHVLQSFIGLPIGIGAYLCARLFLHSPLMIRHEENRSRRIWARGKD